MVLTFLFWFNWGSLVAILMGYIDGKHPIIHGIHYTRGAYRLAIALIAGFINLILQEPNCYLDFIGAFAAYGSAFYLFFDFFRNYFAGDQLLYVGSTALHDRFFRALFGSRVESLLMVVKICILILAVYAWQLSCP